jgi:hypothetical protein
MVQASPRRCRSAPSNRNDSSISAKPKGLGDLPPRGAGERTTGPGFRRISAAGCNASGAAARCSGEELKTKLRFHTRAESRLYEAHCQSCGAKTRIAHGQPPPRCPHCWTPLVAVIAAGSESPSGDPASGGSTQGLAALLAAGTGPRGAADPSPTGMVTCRLCGMFVDPQQFCSDCGAPLPRVRAA